MGKRKKRIISNSLLFMAPALIIYSVFVIYPFLANINVSLTDWNGISPSYNYIGFANFRKLLQINLVNQSVINTIIFTVGNVILASVLSLFLALIFDKPLKTVGFMKTIFFIPVILSTMVVGTLWNYMYSYDGIINSVLSKIGLAFFVQDWLGNGKTAIFMLLITQSWEWIGFMSVIYLANLQVIPQDLYEAAEVDGASAVQRFFHITLPMLVPAITITSVDSFVGGIRTFDLPFIMTRGGPGYASSTIGYAIYELGFESQQMSVGCSLSLILLLVTLVIAVLQIFFLKKREVEV